MGIAIITTSDLLRLVPAATTRVHSSHARDLRTRCRTTSWVRRPPQCALPAWLRGRAACCGSRRGR
eukprot:5614365-Prymnesium_polylepis.1